MFEIINSVISSKISKKMKSRKITINADDNIGETIMRYPEIREKLKIYVPLLEKVEGTWIFDNLIQKMTFREFANYANLKIKDLLEFLSSEEVPLSKSSAAIEKPAWIDEIEFIEIDARKLSGFFLKDILERENELSDERGLKVIQSFLAAPLISLLESKGYKSYTEKVNDNLYYFYFRKKKSGEIKNVNVNVQGKPQIVIQSATPVVYPVLLKLLQTEDVRKAVDVPEYKVWEETEKHLGWIVNGKADLSFSAILAMANLANNKDIVKLESIVVWDNFYLVTRDKNVKSFADLIGKEIYMPLFFNAPPAKITHYLMRQFGYNPNDFNFVYGKPFGRPEVILEDIVQGKIENALLREPEVSYALVRNEEISVAFSYNELWKEIHPGSFGLPNAGVVLKREWIEKFPQEADLLLKEIEVAVNWVKENPTEAAELSYKEMNHSFDEVLKFLSRVHYEYKLAGEVKSEIVNYLSVIEGKKRAELAVSKMLDD